MRKVAFFVVLGAFAVGATDRPDVVMKAKAHVRSFPGAKVKGIDGEVYFYQYGDMSVHVFGEIRNLPKNKTFALHVHQFGDCSSPKAPGGHFDPYMSGKHGHPTAPIGTHHSGDLPNIRSDSKGIAKVDFKTKAFTVIPSPYSVLGRSVVIHAGVDDYKTQPAGGAGERIGCGVIGVVK